MGATHSVELTVFLSETGETRWILIAETYRVRKWRDVDVSPRGGAGFMFLSTLPLRYKGTWQSRDLERAVLPLALAHSKGLTVKIFDIFIKINLILFCYSVTD